MVLGLLVCFVFNLNLLEIWLLDKIFSEKHCLIFFGKVGPFHVYLRITLFYNLLDFFLDLVLQYFLKKQFIGFFYSLHFK